MYFVITLSKLKHEQFFLLFVEFWHSFLRWWVSSCLCQNPSPISLIYAFIISPTVPGCNVLMKFHCGFVVEWLLLWKIISIRDFLSQPKCKHSSIFYMLLFKNYFILNSCSLLLDRYFMLLWPSPIPKFMLSVFDLSLFSLFKDTGLDYNVSVPGWIYEQDED